MEKYETNDILLAATLIYSGWDLEDMFVNGTKGTFVFYDVDDEIISQYNLGKCRVEPIEYNNKIKQLTTSVRRMTQKEEK